MEEIDINIGSRFRKMRKELGYSQKDIGERIGIDRPTINRIELSKRLPSAHTLYRLMELNVSLDWLLYGIGNKIIIPDDHYLNNLTSEEIEILGLIKEKLTISQQEHFWELVDKALRLILDPSDI